MTFGEGTKDLEQFVAQVKLANGEIHKLKYTVNSISTLSEDKKFNLIDISSSESGGIKQLQQIEQTLSSYKEKFSRFNKENVGLLNNLLFDENGKASINESSTAISNLEYKVMKFQESLNNLSNGIGSVDSVKDAFNELNTTASTITTNMKSMNSSYNVVDNAINTIRKMPNVIEELNVSFGKLKEQPQDVADRIKSLGDKLKDLNQLESEQGRNQAWSESYKALNQIGRASCRERVSTPV